VSEEHSSAGGRLKRSQQIREETRKAREELETLGFTKEQTCKLAPITARLLARTIGEELSFHSAEPPKEPRNRPDIQVVRFLGEVIDSLPTVNGISHRNLLDQMDTITRATPVTSRGGQLVLDGLRQTLRAMGREKAKK